MTDMPTNQQGGDHMGDTQDASITVDEALRRAALAEIERDRLRELIHDIRRAADEWAVSRMTDSPKLENEKGERLWQIVRRASTMGAPIQASKEVTT